MADWSKLLSKMPRYAAPLGAAAVGAAALMTPEEAQAAGVSTIMEKLGVGLEEASKIKHMAARNIPQDLFEQNIRALQDIKGYKKTPTDYTRIGQGADYRAVLTPDGQVLKVPIGQRGFNDPTAQYAPSLVHQAGLGPATKTMTVGNKTYMLQEPVTPLDSISKGTSRPGGDKPLERLYKQIDQIWKTIPDDQMFAVKSPEVQAKLDALENQIQKRKVELYKEQGIDPDEMQKQISQLEPHERGQFHDVDDSYPAQVFEKLMEVNASKKLEPKITPWDMHEGNIGLSRKTGEPVVFDTSRFKNFRPENLTPEERQKILDANIMVPERKQFLKEQLEAGPQEDFGTIPDDENTNDIIPTHEVINNKPNWTKDSQGNWVTKGRAAAGLGGAAALGGLASGTNQASAESMSPVPSIERGFNAIRAPLANAARSASDAIVSGTTPLQGPEKQQFVEQNAPIFGGAAEMAVDPLNYIPGGPELGAVMDFPKLKKYFQGRQDGQ